MRILAIADEESKFLWDYYKEGCLEGVDMILSAGDLSSDYLEFLVTMTGLPVFYVHGNHDIRYDEKEPGGCTCVDDDIIMYNGVRILGLGGSMCYNKKKYQYTDDQMTRRVLRLLPKICRYRGFDILLTHSPARGLHDAEDLPHRGFQIFNWLIAKFKPRFFIYGHVHQSYGGKYARYDRVGETNLINAYERCIFEYEDENVKDHIVW
ncbi:MAG: metallophosphoesterase [Lachnospiraceae bacterium]|nr:metallophosphoesterase [Lachnospiraceae bacterium]